MLFKFSALALLVPLVAAGYTCDYDVKALVTLSSLNNAVTGNITLTQKEGCDEVHLAGQISGLADGLHGFHIHAFGDLSGGCNSTGGHYNPFNRTHGAPEDKKRHVGDLGNIESKGGQAVIDITDKVITLCGRRTILGRGVVVHAGQDDLGLGGKPDSKTTGAAGARAACGIIGVIDETK